MEYILHLRTRSLWLIGGQYSSLAVDKATARKGEQEQPYLPASALKGAMRIEFERLMRGWGEEVCISSDPEVLQACWERHPDDIVCSLFGVPGKRPGKLRFWNAFPSEERDWRLEGYETRTGVSISRPLRRAQPQRLFTFEGARQVKLEARITCLEPLTDREGEWFERALCWWQKEGLWVGANRSRGMGRLELLQWEIRGEPLPSPSAKALKFQPQGSKALYWLTFESREPLRVSPIKLRPYLLRGMSFVPGSTIRGAVAFALLRQGLSREDLDRIFSAIAPDLQGLPRFSHLYPGGFLDIRPLSAVQCKVHGHDRDPHGPYDTLLLHFFIQQAQGQEEPIRERNLERLRRWLNYCPRPSCEEKLEPAERFPGVHKHLFVKLALSRELMRAQPRMFYIYEAVEKPERFQGVLLADEGVASLLQRRMTLLVGGARGKGFGRGLLSLRRISEPELGDEEGVKQRMRELQERLTQLAESLQLDKGLQERVFFTLTLLTDLVLPPGQSLKGLLEEYNRNWRWEAAVLRWTWLGGFNEWSGQPKLLVPALERGGAVLLSTQEDQDRVSAQLAELEREGLGLLRDQGFGWVQGCHRFHYSRVEVKI